MHMAPKAAIRSVSKSRLQDPIDGIWTDFKVEVDFLGVVLVSRGEIKRFCICRL